MRKLLKNIATICLIFTMSGCSIPIKNREGTVHHLIIGIGVVSVPKKENANGVFATSTKSLGIHLSNQPGLKFAAGYAKSTTVVVPETTDNIVVEVSQKTFGPVKIEINPKIKGGE